MKNREIFKMEAYLLQCGYCYFHSVKGDSKPEYTMSPSNAKRFKSREEAQAYVDEIEGITPYSFHPALLTFPVSE